jgi:hypothetical protein
MEADDRRESVDCYGCGGEGGGGGRFVSWLRAEIQPLKDGVGMIVMVNEMGRKKKTSGGSVAFRVRTCMPPPLPPLLLISKKGQDFFPPWSFLLIRF